MIPRASSPDYSLNAEPTTRLSLQPLLLFSSQQTSLIYSIPPSQIIKLSPQRHPFLNPPHLLRAIQIPNNIQIGNDLWNRDESCIVVVSLSLSFSFFSSLSVSPLTNAKRVLAIAKRWCRKTVPGGTLSLRARLHGAKSRGKAREIGMRRKRGFPLVARARPRTCAPTTPWLSASLHGHPFRFGGAANQSFLREHDGRRR